MRRSSGRALSHARVASIVQGGMSASHIGASIDRVWESSLCQAVPETEEFGGAGQSYFFQLLIFKNRRLFAIQEYFFRGKSVTLFFVFIALFLSPSRM